MDRPFAAYIGEDPYIFVCYAHDDEDIVYPEITHLNEQGIHLWYDEGISAGRVWRAEIAEAIESASKILFYVSNSSLASNHCGREINLALNVDKDILPVYLEDVEAVRRNERLWPPESVIASYMFRWALPHSGLLDEARSFSAKVAESIDRASLDSVYRYTLGRTIYYPLVFEMAMLEGDPAKATAAAEWLAESGDHGIAGILFLRLDDPRAEEQLLAAAESPYFERWSWFQNTVHLTPALREHPLILNVNDALGFTKAWRLELCQRASTLPPESHITCDPSKYALTES